MSACDDAEVWAQGSEEHLRDALPTCVFLGPQFLRHLHGEAVAAFSVVAPTKIRL